MKNCITSNICDNLWYLWATSYNSKEPNPSCPCQQFKFRVTNPDGEGIQGVEYTLYRLESDGADVQFQVVAVAASDKNGVADFGLIPMRSYIMRETARPDGYVEDNHVYRITANCDGIMINGFALPEGGFVIVLTQYGSCPQPPPDPTPRSSHNPAVLHPQQIFNSLHTSGNKHTMKGNERLPADFDSPILAGGGWFCHVQGFGKYGSNLIVSHNADKGRRFGYFVVSEEAKSLGHRYDAYYELPGDARNFNHTGGFQIIGDYLAMGIETPDYKNSIIALYDIKNMRPECAEAHAGPQFKRLLRGVKNNNCVATSISNFKILQNGVEQPYFLMVTHEDDFLVMYLAQGDDLLTANFYQVHLLSSGVKDYQGLSLITENIGGTHDLAYFYLVAPFTTDNFLGIPTNDYCDLWHIGLTGNLQSNPTFAVQKLVDGKHFSTHGGTIGIKTHFRWGSGVEITDSDNFRLHTTERNFATVANFELVYNTFSK